MKNNKKNIARSVLSIAIAMALVPATSYAGLKPFDIKGLPQAGAIYGIRAGKASNGDVVITWISDSNLYGQRIFNNGILDGDSLGISNDISNFAGLAVNSNGSFVVGWPTSSGIKGVKVEAKTLGTPFVVSPDITSVPVQALAKTDGYAIAWVSSLVNFAANDTPGAVEPIGAFDSVAMDSGGDFFVATANNGKISITKNNDQTIDIPASKQISTYGFGEGKNPNKSVSFVVGEPEIAANDSGEFVVVWNETEVDITRKVHKVCYTYYGKKLCADVGFTYTSSSISNINSRRYNNTLQAKDTKPLVVASAKGIGVVLGSAHVVLDADGDFTVAYISGKVTYAPSNSYGEQDIITAQSEVFVKQFVNNKANKLVAGTATQVSSKPKLAAKHTLKNSTNLGPSIVVTDEKTNAFMVFWHNDYEDHYKDYENTTQVCDKFKTVSYDGYSYKECVHYKTVPTDASDNVSILKAKRYNTK
ncbi:MAG: hypothetical protein NTV43_03530 [Methylococcales bacterium]|nr:hypothetical protein [Methylococcales bacterium]